MLKPENYDVLKIGIQKHSFIIVCVYCRPTLLVC